MVMSLLSAESSNHFSNKLMELGAIEAILGKISHSLKTPVFVARSVVSELLRGEPVSHEDWRALDDHLQALKSCWLLLSH